MRVLVIGGTGFIGRHVVDSFLRLGHKVAVFHRGRTTAKFYGDVHYIVDDRRNLEDHTKAVQRFAPDITIDLALYKAREARTLMTFMKGLTSRVIIISSIDVYRVYERVLGSNMGHIETTALREQASLRETTYPYKGKVCVEKAVLESQNLPYTILRLPLVYGPGDSQHRLLEYVKPMDDHRPVILMDRHQAEWRGTRGYVENVAVAIYLAATQECAAGKIYNVGEVSAFTEIGWVEQIARVTGWKGHVEILPAPGKAHHLRSDENLRQYWVVDTTRIRADLGYKELVPVGEGIVRSVEWERAHPPAVYDSKRFDYKLEDAVISGLRAGIA